MTDALRKDDAEMSVLGALILWEPGLGRVIGKGLKVSHFVLPAHREIFRAMVALHERGTNADLLSLREMLVTLGALTEVGGEEYLINLAENVPSLTSAEHYCDLVMGAAERRAYIESSRQLAKAAMDPEVPLEAVRALAAGVTVQGGTVPIQHLKDIDANEVDRGISTGWPTIDGLISTAGWPLGQTSVVRAYHKSGKSTFMLQSAMHSARRGRRVLYGTFADLSGVRIKRRLLRNATSWSNRPVGEESEKFDLVLHEMEKVWNFYVYDASKQEGGNEIEAFAAWCRSSHDVTPWDLIVLDYAQEFTSSDRRATDSIAEQNICARVVNRMAAQMPGVAVVVGSQITVGGAGEKAKTKYSRAWEEKAGWVLTLEKDEPDATGFAKSRCESTYSRFGVDHVSVDLMWHPSTLTFEEVDPFA